jgi:HEAT repeat protein/2-polyprenyl-3-methyl-5-hydroxy-6-metoxy-1,4-benzoquinol methylase
MSDHIEEYLRQVINNPDINKWDTPYTHLDVKEPLLMSMRPWDKRGGRDERDVEDVVVQEGRLIISGASGMGKTTTLKWLTIVYAEKYLEDAERQVPLYVELAGFEGGSFYDHALTYAKENGLKEGDFKGLLDGGRLALFIDGLDLLESSKDFEPAIEIRKFMSNNPGCKFVLSSRPGLFEGFKSRCKVSEFVELSDPKIKEYIHKYLVDVDNADTLIRRIFDRRNERLKLLCRNPMLLHLVTELQENDRIADDRAGIYRESVEGIIRHYQKKGKILLSDGQLVRDVLKELAFSMQTGNTVRLDYGSALDVVVLCGDPERYGGTNARQVLKDCFGLGFLRKVGDKVEFEFHQSFQEYFAAVKLKEVFEHGCDISESFSHPRWEDTLVFLSEITERYDELFDDVIGADEIFLAAKLALRVDDRRVENLCARLLDRIDSEFELERNMAVGSFAYIGDRAVELLIDLLKDDYSWVRSWAATILRRSGSEKAVELLIGALKDMDSKVRSEAVNVLGKIGSEKAVEPLIDALKDVDKWVRMCAVIALWKIGGERAVESLTDAQNNDDLLVRSWAAMALGGINAEKSVEPIPIVELDDGDSLMQREAVMTLWKVGDEKSVELLIDVLKGDDSLVRWTATEALKSLCGPMHREKLEPLLESENIDVASATFEILHSIKLKEQEKIKIFKELKYLLRWDDIPENDSDRLLKYLIEDHDIAWAERAKIRKSDGKTLIISKDKNSAEIKIDERGEKSTLKLSDGRTCDLNVRTKKAKSVYTTLSVAKDAEEMFMDRHIGALVEHLKHIPDSFTIVDYGCGKGAFLCVMKNLEVELGKIHYIGVDSSRGNLYIAGRTAEEYGIADKLNSCRFMKSDKFLNESFNIDHVFFVHVLHEIPLKDLPNILVNLFSRVKAGSIITILEQMRLVEPERDFVTWNADDFNKLFSEFAKVSPYPYHTKNGNELITVGLKRLDTDVDLKSMRERCLKVYEHKKKRVGKERASSDLNERDRQYLSELYANICVQIDEIDEYQNSVTVGG